MAGMADDLDRLDVAQHMSLCRHYVRELRRSILVGTPDLDHGRGSARSSAVLDNMGDMSHDVAGPSFLITEKEKDQDAQMSAFLREEAAEEAASAHEKGHSARNSDASSRSRQSDGSASEGHIFDGPERNSFTSSHGRPSSSHGRPSSSQDRRSSESNSPPHAVARTDIRQSAEKILYTFLLPGAEREIILPHSITNDITVSIEELGRDDPEVFDAAKDYVFQAMERDAFPGFLRMKALGNLIPTSSMARLILGLLAMFGGFWAAFIMIFIDEPRNMRCWLILPFTIGVYALATHQYFLDPIMGLMGFSEYAWMKFSKIREPFIRTLINKRSLIVLGVTILVDAALCCLFIFVPGKYL